MRRGSLQRAAVARALGAVLGGGLVAAGLLGWLSTQSTETDGTLAFELGSRAAQLGAPAWLLLLAAAPAVFVVRLGSLADFSRGQLLLQAAVRTALLFLMALVLARPALHSEAVAVSVVAVADVSDSVTDRDLEGARGFLAEVERAADPRRFRLIRFARWPEEVVATQPPTTAALGRLPPLAGAGTDIALGLGLGYGLIEPGTIPRILLLSDGRATGGDTLAEAERAAARGVRIFFRHLADASLAGDVAIDGLTAPDEIRPHGSFEIEVRVLASHDGQVTLRLEQDGRPHLPEPERRVALRAGTTTVAWTTRIDQPGTSVYRARIVAADRNHRTENDEGTLAVAAQGRPRVLLVQDEPGAAAAFARALEAESIDVEVRGPRGAPARADLEPVDLVVLSDVPRSELTDRQMRALESYVRDGGGLLVAGGPGSFGSGGYAGTRIEPLLPVRIDLPGRREEATLALALVIDKSGSMSGARMDLTKEAARATAEMMAPEDQIAIVVFDSQAAPLVRLQRAANRGHIRTGIARLQPSGGTNILAGLRDGLEELYPAQAKKKHVILLSDGQSQYDDLPELVDDAVAAHITISAVGVGDGADQTMLRTIAARGGGRFYHTRDPASIPRIFTRETAELSRSSIVEEPTTARIARRAEMLAGIPFESAPPLRGYVAARPRPSADLILTTGKGEPLFARWQIGLGQVAAWTSDLKARWAVDWIRWPSFGKFWAQAARSTMRRRATHRLPMRTTLDGETVSVTIDAVGPDDRFMTGLRGDVEATHTADPPGRRSLPLMETAPGLYQAAFPAGPPGALLLSAKLARADALPPVVQAGGRLTIPFAPELRPAAAATAADGEAASAGAAARLSSRPLLEAIATRTGGREASSAAAVMDPGPDRVTALRPIRTPLLLAALALFLLDVLLRRVRLPKAGASFHV